MYSVPAVKYVTRAAVHLSLLVLHFLVLSLSFTSEELQRTLLTDPLPLVVESASGDMSSGSGAALAVGTTATVEWGGSILSTPAFPAVTTLSYPEILLFALCLTIFLDRCHVETTHGRECHGGLWLAKPDRRLYDDGLGVLQSCRSTARTVGCLLAHPMRSTRASARVCQSRRRRR